MITQQNHSLDLTIQLACDASNIPSKAQLKKWIEAAMDRPATITIRFVDSMEGAQLNHDFRQKDYATNVLTFAYECGQMCEADLVLCPEVVAKEAEEQRKSIVSHYAHLVIHGTLHAIGYDHQTDETASEMETKEIAILAFLGFDNPYQDR